MDFEKELSEIYPWILKVARKFCCSMQDAEDLAGSAISNCTAHSILFDDLVSTIQRCAKKSRCIDSVMYYASGYSYDEISEILNIPVGTVRSRISSARKFILQEISY